MKQRGKQERPMSRFLSRIGKKRCQEVCGTRVNRWRYFFCSTNDCNATLTEWHDRISLPTQYPPFSASRFLKKSTESATCNIATWKYVHVPRSVTPEIRFVVRPHFRFRFTSLYRDKRTLQLSKLLLRNFVWRLRLGTIVWIVVKQQSCWRRI